MTLGWKQGRKLSYASNNGVSFSYDYDAEGYRYRKKSGSTVYSYTTIDGVIYAETQTVGDVTTTLHYLFDESGTRYGFVLNGTDTYYYKFNLQGDVIGIYNESGSLVVIYKYDAWGKLLSTTGPGALTVGTANPFRYRGYYYDAETGFYFCTSRYYDPEVGRWINADALVAGVSEDTLGFNQFVYCFNNPVNMSDETGHWPKWIKNTVKWVAKNIVRPVVKMAEETLSKIDLTYSEGFNISGTPGAIIFNGQIGVSMDTKGNVAIQGSLGGGFTGGSECISVSKYQSITNAPSIKKLNGTGYQTGGSVVVPIEGVPLNLGCDLNIIPDPRNDKTYYGVTLTQGVAYPNLPSVEGHVEWGETFTIQKTQFNIFDVARSVYNKIMEW